MNALDYWQECLSNAADECDLVLSDEHLKILATAAMCGHDEYGQAFYSPPASDRISVIEDEAARKLKALQREFDEYRANAETAVKRALGQYDDTVVTIQPHGEVLRHNGRTERIQ